MGSRQSDEDGRIFVRISLHLSRNEPGLAVDLHSSTLLLLAQRRCTPATLFSTITFSFRKGRVSMMRIGLTLIQRPSVTRQPPANHLFRHCHQDIALTPHFPDAPHMYGLPSPTLLASSQVLQHQHRRH
ncbi:hypothetical protein BYT27DRAFT_7297055 [Phlegmacium glaucopus]|nr:hypothetical protein BYT27DRAFT_7297055 [Phlegmacium glaucopus]